MGKNLFSVPIFFIVFRETLEAAIIVSVLLGLAEQIVQEDKSSATSTRTGETTQVATDEDKAASDSTIDDEPHRRRLLRKLRIQIFAGSLLGLLIALSIGAAFIAVWFTKASNLWQKSEELWEGIFSLIASLMIFVMGVTMLKMDKAKAKWRIKLERAFDGSDSTGTRTSRYALFLLPFITVLREGLEAVVFVGGVSLGQQATAIPIAAIVGIICGLTIGFIIYQFASRTTLRIFLLTTTSLLLLLGSGLFSKAILFLQINAFNRLLGADVDDLSSAGDGPGSYDVRGNVWHLNCCNPENKLDGDGWGVFGALFGWTNSATLGSVLGYVFYWLCVIAVLIYMKWSEGRTTILGYESAARKRRLAERARGASEKGGRDGEGEGEIPVLEKEKDGRREGSEGSEVEVK